MGQGGTLMNKGEFGAAKWYGLVIVIARKNSCKRRKYKKLWEHSGGNGHLDLVQIIDFREMMTLEQELKDE